MTSRHRALLASTLAAALLLVLPRPATAQSDCVTPGETWVVESFTADYDVRPNGSIAVTEQIEVDFQDLQKHGIYRDLRRRFRRPAASLGERVEGLPGSGAWEEASFDLEVESVVDERGDPYEVETSDEGDLLRIRIGDPDFCVGGRRVYVIRYEINDGVVQLGDFDELYWQATGTEWVAPIERAVARVTLPAEYAAAHTDRAPWDASCYAGYAESTGGPCTARVVSPGVYEFRTTEPLQPGQGLTFAATFPAGLLPGPSLAERLWDLFLLLGPLAIPPFALVFMIGIWWRRGKEPAMGSIVPEWNPPDGVRPGVAGALRDHRADMDDIVATILDLAVRGVLKIREVPPKLLPELDNDSLLGKALETVGLRKRDWEIVRVERGVFGLAPYEHQILTALLESRDERRLSDLRNKFHTEIPEIRNQIYRQLVDEKYFLRSPQATRRMWLGIGAGLIFGSIFLAAKDVTLGSPTLLWAIGVAGLIVLPFAFIMPAMTRHGAQVRRQIEGLEEYIRRAEKAELEFRNAPEKTPELFDRLLPFAVALDVSDVWAQQFESVVTSSPVWYEGTNGSGFRTNAFVESLSDFRSSASKLLASAPGADFAGGGSFGGGSVGGGGGGGGGGSW
jgi:uncharacterized membrane protein YgcG